MLPEPPMIHASPKNEEVVVHKSKLSRIDFAGAFILALIVCAFSLFLDAMGRGKSMTSPLCYMPFLVTTLGLPSFIWVEKRFAQEPILPITLLTNKDFLLPCLVVGFQHAAQCAVRSYHSDHRYPR